MSQSWLSRSRSEALGEPSDFSLRGLQQSAGDCSDRGSFGKSLGYRVKGDWGKVWLIEDRKDGLPPVRLEFRFKRVQPVEIGEAPAVRPRPRKQPTQPEGVLLLRERGAPRQRREAERHVFAIFFGNSADGGVDHQFRRPIRRAVAANDLLDQPPVA